MKRFKKDLYKLCSDIAEGGVISLQVLDTAVRLVLISKESELKDALKKCGLEKETLPVDLIGLRRFARTSIPAKKLNKAIVKATEYAFTNHRHCLFKY
ncbi:MAG: hypothetical protein KAS07_05530 [Candidatus Pacebacteria bacterium]|nr:hypothetical protein [Candidatus Paceibacterota bacterium]